MPLWPSSIIDILIFIPAIPILLLILPLYSIKRYTPITYPRHSIVYNLSNLLNTPDAQRLVVGILLELILGFLLQQNIYIFFNTIRTSTTSTLTAYYQVLNTCAHKFENLDCSGGKGTWEYSKDRADICKMYAECMMTPMDPIKIGAWWKEFLVLRDTWAFYWRIGLMAVVLVLWVWCVLSIVRLLWACWRGKEIGRTDILIQNGEKGNLIRGSGRQQSSLEYEYRDENEDDEVEEVPRVEHSPTLRASRASSSSSRRRNGGSVGPVPRYYPLSYGRNEKGERYRL